MVYQCTFVFHGNYPSSIDEAYWQIDTETKRQWDTVIKDCVHGARP
jgi:hypothetical protein